MPDHYGVLTLIDVELQNNSPQYQCAVPPFRLELVAAIATLPHEAFGWLLGQLQWIAAEAGGFQPDSQAALRQLAPLITAFFEASQKPDVGAPASSSGLPSVNQWRREG